ncbi:hypothetical protein EYC84_003366 [Monilinia fructicola]|uniref:Uncharacterized protein n=1 Tax=Monilinia fructicola TaxID=38448 RepID=A0A5M9K1J6_MONFR|nr:hypothetical protein EYC84_003366 [Monilinia fructicola]
MPLFPLIAVMTSLIPHRIQLHLTVHPNKQTTKQTASHQTPPPSLSNPNPNLKIPTHPILLPPPKTPPPLPSPPLTQNVPSPPPPPLGRSPRPHNLHLLHAPPNAPVPLAPRLPPFIAIELSERCPGADCEEWRGLESEGERRRRAHTPHADPAPNHRTRSRSSGQHILALAGADRRTVNRRLTSTQPSPDMPSFPFPPSHPVPEAAIHLTSLPLPVGLFPWSGSHPHGPHPALHQTREPAIRDSRQRCL